METARRGAVQAHLDPFPRADPELHETTAVGRHDGVGAAFPGGLELFFQDGRGDLVELHGEAAPEAAAAVRTGQIDDLGPGLGQQLSRRVPQSQTPQGVTGIVDRDLAEAFPGLGGVPPPSLFVPSGREARKAESSITRPLNRIARARVQGSPSKRLG